MNILLVTSEALPYAKSGGLGDFINSFSKALVKEGQNVSYIMPLYKCIRDKYPKVMEGFYDEFTFDMGWRHMGAGIFHVKENGVDIYFVANDRFDRDNLYGYGDDTERFAVFVMAVNTFITRHNDFDVVHCNDWQTAVLPLLLKYNDKHPKTVLTIHNPAYQGWAKKEDVSSYFNLDYNYFDSGYVRMGDSFNFLKSGIMAADKVNTVSKTHANELLNDHYGFNGIGAIIDWCRHYDFSGIVNGLDQEEWNPKTDSNLFYNYDVNSYKKGKKENKKKILSDLGLDPNFNGPLFSAITRLSSQKGIERIVQLFPLLQRCNARMIIIGTGELEGLVLSRIFNYPNAYLVKKYDEKMAHLLYAASDFFLMPSYFEPCGTSQLISMKYGTLPIVSNVGGLNDTVNDVSDYANATGYVFKNWDNNGINNCFFNACNMFAANLLDDMIKRGMNSDFSWSKSAKEYINLYNSIKR